MHNGVALQGGTSHYFGDGWAKFRHHVHGPRQQAVSTHPDLLGRFHPHDRGAHHGARRRQRPALPPKVAPIQLAIIPIAQHKPGVLDKANALFDALKGRFRVKLDDTDNSPGWKFSQYEMQGVPLRLRSARRTSSRTNASLSAAIREKDFRLAPLTTSRPKSKKALEAVHRRCTSAR